MASNELVLQGQVRWFDYGEPVGSQPAGLRPAIVIQGDSLNHSNFQTTVIASVTSQLRWATMQGAVFIPAGIGGLPRDSVVALWSLTTVNKWELGPILGMLPNIHWLEIERAMDQMMGRSA